MNKSELVQAVAARLGADHKSTAAIIDATIEEITRAVSKGDRVGIVGFGTFEKRNRAARTARNPRTGEAIKIKKTSVPGFKAGAGFKQVVSGEKKLPAAAKSAAKATKAPAKTAAKKAAPAKAAKAPARKTAAKKAPAKKTARR